MKGYDRLSDRELAAAAQSGDTFAEGELVKRYAQLAEGISRSYRLVGGDGDDLKQIALIALLEAVRSYDPTRGAEFATYASACMRNRVLDAVRSAAAGKNAVLNDSLRIDGFKDRNQKQSDNIRPTRGGRGVFRGAGRGARRARPHRYQAVSRLRSVQGDLRAAGHFRKESGQHHLQRQKEDSAPHRRRKKGLSLTIFSKI